MKKLTLLVAATFACATAGFAQTKAIEETGFGDNWFIQGQGGASYTISEYHKDASFSDVIAPHVALNVGKYFSPVIGVRAGVAGWQSKNYIVDSKRNTDGTFKSKYVQLNADVLFNLSNLFAGYNPERVFDFSVFGGISYNHSWSIKNRIGSRNFISPRVGIQGDFRLNEAVSLNLEVAGNLYTDNFNGIKQAKKHDATINALAGITYRFPQRGFKSFIKEDQSVIDALNAKLNEQRSLLDGRDSKIANLESELAKKPSVIVKENTEIKEDTEILMNAVVVFHIGSANLEKNQDINVYNAARYLQDNPQMDVIVTGYADKSTGTAAGNQKLSEKRAKTVADILTNKYSISSSRITTKASGDKEQLFPTDQWNRVVVFVAKKAR